MSITLHKRMMDAAKAAKIIVDEPGNLGWAANAFRLEAIDTLVHALVESNKRTALVNYERPHVELGEAWRARPSLIREVENLRRRGVEPPA